MPRRTVSNPSIYLSLLGLWFRQLAIVRGAAICGLGGLKVKSRRCRRHYGFQLDLPYDPNLDDSRHKYENKFDGRILSRGTMVWKVKKVHTYFINVFDFRTRLRGI